MLQQHQASTKHGLAAGADHQPERPDWTTDQNWSAYTAQEHGIWKTLFERQSRLLPGRACDEFMRGLQDLPIGPEQIPNFEALSEKLMQRTGWQVVAVPGLVPDDVFLSTWPTAAFRQAISSANRMSWTIWKSPTSFMTYSAMCPCS